MGSDEKPVIDTGRECGTSASSAPSVTTSCTPSASARSMIALAIVRQRMFGSGPASSTRSRGARGTRASKNSTVGHSISRERPSTSLICGRVAWKSKKSSGSSWAKRVAPSDAPTNWAAADAASPASFQPLNAQIMAGARNPSGRRSHCNGGIRITVHHGLIPSAGLSERQRAGDVAVATLRVGQQIDAVFACSRKDRLVSRSGAPYLALELRDRTGAVAARAFRDADVLAGRFDRGDLVRVRGRIERFREELQIDVQAIARADGAAADPAAFLPVAYRDLDELDGFLEHLAGEVTDRPFAALLRRLLGDTDLRAAWRRAPCTRGGHHAYLGGLLEHTVAVATLAAEACTLHPRLEHDLLITAALVHDLGKTREFTLGAEIGLSEEGRLLGHVALGLSLLEEAGRDLLDAERRLALAHCVLCHHGADAAPGRRFGSPEALALFRLNALDASVKDALEHGLDGKYA